MATTAETKPAAAVDSPSDLYSPHTAAMMVGVASSTIHKWIEWGRIEAFPALTERQRRYPGAVLVSLMAVETEKRCRAQRVSARQAALLLGVSYTTARYYCLHGYLLFERRGKLFEIDREDVLRLRELRERGEGPALRKLLPRTEPRPCELEGCGKLFTPTPGQVRNGYGKFCCHEHYAEDLRRRCRDGALVLPLMVELPRARQRWMGRWNGHKGAAGGIEAGRAKGGAPTLLTADQQVEILELDKQGMSSRKISEQVLGDARFYKRVQRFLKR